MLMPQLPDITKLLNDIPNISKQMTDMISWKRVKIEGATADNKINNVCKKLNELKPLNFKVLDFNGEVFLLYTAKEG